MVSRDWRDVGRGVMRNTLIYEVQPSEIVITPDIDEVQQTKDLRYLNVKHRDAFLWKEQHQSRLILNLMI